MHWESISVSKPFAMKRFFKNPALFVLIVTSCSKNYLDQPFPQDGSLSDNVIFSTYKGAEAAVVGSYGLLRSESFNSYNGLNNAVTIANKGVKSVVVNFELKGNDLYVASSVYAQECSWNDNAQQGRAAFGTRTLQIWDMFYRIINNANAAIANIPQVRDASPEVKSQLIAEAKAQRAYCYFWLARIYQFSYSRNPDAAAVPLYTAPAGRDSKGNPRASLRAVYAQIVDDLNEAVSLLPVERSGKFRINKNVAHALLAQVYQEMAGNTGGPELWEKARQHAAAARQGYPLMDNAGYLSGFNSISSGEWIWGLPVPVEQSLSYMHPIFAYFNPDKGYAKNVSVNASFAACFLPGDIRRSQISQSSNTAPWKTRKYVSSAEYANSSYGGGDILLIRSAEMILIEAEALAWMNSIPEAIDLLWSIRGTRVPGLEKNVNLPLSITKEDLIEQILLERRWELYGEIGVEYFDLKRLQKPLIRDGDHPYRLTIPANDKRWLFQIPQAEIDANPNIEQADQNP